MKLSMGTIIPAVIFDTCILSKNCENWCSGSGAASPNWILSSRFPFQLRGQRTYRIRNPPFSVNWLLHSYLRRWFDSQAAGLPHSLPPGCIEDLEKYTESLYELVACQSEKIGI